MKILVGIGLMIVGGVLFFLSFTTASFPSIVNAPLLIIGFIALAAGGILLTWGFHQRRTKEIVESKVMVVTTDTIPGKRIVKTLGNVQAQNNPLLGAGVAEIDARRNLIKEAQKLGANAIVGLRSERRQHKSQITYYMYGTAVIVEPVEE